MLNQNTQAWAKIDLPTGLYIVSTPIGNLRDITLRALDTLASVDEIYAEDTRQTQKLLSCYGLSVKQTSYNDHNAAKRRPEVIGKLKDGKSIALVSDAGTPLISDPGWKLVTESIDAGIEVISVPGASAPLAGLVVSGLPSDRFLFAGFLPSKSGARRQTLRQLSEVKATLIFFERGSRLSDTLKDIGEALGLGRQIVIARELTKFFEEVRRGTVEEIIDLQDNHEAPKGEIVVLVGPPLELILDTATIDEALEKAMRTLSVKNAVAKVSSDLGVARRDCYQRAILIKKT